MSPVLLDRARQTLQVLFQRYGRAAVGFADKSQPGFIAAEQELQEDYFDQGDIWALQGAFLQHLFTSLGVMHHQDTESGFAKGLSTVEGFVLEGPA